MWETGGVVLHKGGYSCNKGAEKMKVASPTVEEIVKKYKETETVKDREGRSNKRRLHYEGFLTR